MAENPTSPEIVVFMVHRDTTCAECCRELYQSSMLRLAAETALRLDCADLAHLEYLPRGDSAHVRHAHTDYDRLLNRFGDRGLARAEVRDDVEAVLEQWQAGGQSS